MKATLEFTLPEEESEYRHALNGSRYFSALGDIVEELKRWAESKGRLQRSKAREIVFEVCARRGFSPWEEP